MREENTFEEKEIAEQWIAAIETPQHRSRELEYYPLLYKWSHDLRASLIVEIGSGQGICSSKIDLASGRYVGIEPSLALIERARTLYPEPSKEFMEGNSYEIPLPDACADGMFSLGVWFHIENLDRAHKEIARIMKGGGKILILTANPDTQRMWESFFDHPKVEGKRIEGKVYVPGGFMSRNVLYMHSRQDISEFLIRNGFSVDSITDIGYGVGDRRLGIFIAVHATKVR